MWIDCGTHWLERFVPLLHGEFVCLVFLDKHVDNTQMWVSRASELPIILSKHCIGYVLSCTALSIPAGCSIHMQEISYYICKMCSIQQSVLRGIPWCIAIDLTYNAFTQYWIINLKSLFIYKVIIEWHIYMQSVMVMWKQRVCIIQRILPNIHYVII